MIRNPANVLFAQLKRRLPGPVLERILIVPLRAALILTRQARTLGAIGIIVSDERRVLLVRQWYRAAWGLPGGYLRRREEPVQGVVREVREETGLDLRDWSEPRIVLQPRRRHIDFVFLGHVDGEVSGRAEPASSEITDVGWFALDHLPDLQPEADAALRAAGLR